MRQKPGAEERRELARRELLQVAGVPRAVLQQLQAVVDHLQIQVGLDLHSQTGSQSDAGRLLVRIMPIETNLARTAACIVSAKS